MKEKKKKTVAISRDVYTAVRVLTYLIVLLVMIFVGQGAVTFCLGLFADGDHVVRLPGQESPVITLESDSDALKPIPIDPSQLVEVTRANIAVAGDVMLHMPIVRSAQTAEGYSFDGIFTFIQPYVSAADYAAANLETTLSGTDKHEYTGYPDFNSPDQIAAGARRAGFDMLLTGNNHCYDYGTDGLQRTLRTLAAQNLATLGTMAGREDSRHTIQTIGGVRVGMISYTFGTIDESGNVTLNGHTAAGEAAGLINVFDYGRLGQFYTEIDGEIAAMRANGADAVIVYLHWGDDYSAKVSEDQKAIAQKLCDLGVDVIVGSHPHVIQPVDILTSTVDPGHTTLCLYSLGNFLSNQRADNISLTTGHSEDGLLFTFTLSKYNDGSVRVSAVKALPTWVLVRGTGDNREFCILPLDRSITGWQSAFGLSDAQLESANNSYNRTMALISTGLEKVTAHLAELNGALDPSLGVG